MYEARLRAALHFEHKHTSTIYNYDFK